MRFRGKKSKNAKKKEEDYVPHQEDPEPDFKPDQSEDQVPSKVRHKVVPVGQKTRKAKQVKKQSENQQNQDSGPSEVLEVRDKEDNLRQFHRPAFLNRWDGISNELDLTTEEIEEMTPMLQVYWKTKCQNMRAVIFLEFGKMEYFAFENDAILLNELTKKRLKRFCRFIMVNFWCKQIEVVKKQLFERRIPVLIMKEIQDIEYRQKYGLVRREVQEVITPAIHPLVQTTTTRERLLVALFRLESTFAYIVLDGETNQFLLDQIVEDPNFHETRRVLNRYRPVELVIPRKGHQEVAQIARQISNPFIVELKIQTEGNIVGDFLDKISTQTGSPLLKGLMKHFVQQGQNQGPAFSRYRAVMSLQLVWKYLSDLSLREKIFNQGLFSEGEGQSFRAPFFDSQVYQNLQIFRLRLTEQQTYSKPGTLLHYLDHCKTLQGRKLLHKWLDCPPSNLHDVLIRQKAVCELIQKPKALIYHDRMIAFEKLGRKLADIYHWIERSSERGKLILTRNINFQKEYDIMKNPAVTRIRQMLQVAKFLKQYESFLKEISSLDFSSEILLEKTTLRQVENLHLMSWEEINGMKGLPELSYVADAVFRITLNDQITGTIEPAAGQCQTFDQNKKQYMRVLDRLNSELQRWREYFNCPKVKFVSVRAKNEIEVPKSFIKKEGKSNPHKDLIFSSQISGAVRYVTGQSSGLSSELMEYEEAMARSYEPFLQKLIADFSRFRGLWDKYVQSSAWIDALMSLAQTSKRMGLRCLPTFREEGLGMVGAIHPSLTEVLDSVVPNSMRMKAEERVLLLTGPNMGGKSTLLKQTCLLVILAQLGCFVPAQEYSAPVFDQIFCRIGASDRILQGKSTFYVQLEETKRIINKATQNSLVVIDELGRGTSTFDGMAIAESVLDHLILSVRAITLFSTHYTQITQRYVLNPNVKLAKMGYEFDDVGLVFTYQLMDGVAEKSFASNVVKMVGTPTQILQNAAKRTEEMHHETKRKKLLRDATQFAGLLKVDRKLMKAMDQSDNLRGKHSLSKQSTNLSESRVLRSGLGRHI